MTCDHMLVSDHDDAYVDAMLMVHMQANTRSVTVSKTAIPRPFPTHPARFSIGSTSATNFRRNRLRSIRVWSCWIDPILQPPDTHCGGVTGIARSTNCEWAHGGGATGSRSSTPLRASGYGDIVFDWGSASIGCGSEA